MTMPIVHDYAAIAAAMKPEEPICPECEGGGWKHVECDTCLYFGPGEGRVDQAIRSHNARALAKIDTALSGMDADGRVG